MPDISLQLQPLTLEEFLAWEETTSLRHEFVAGRVYTMQGARIRHIAITRNIVVKLDDGTPGGSCQVYFADLKVKAARDRVYYPDVVVQCAPHSDQALIVDDPCLIAEVASRSTRRVDRGEKLDAYLAMPSLQAYLVVEQDRRHVTAYLRDPVGRWTRGEFVTSGAIELPCSCTTLSLDDIYAGVEMPPSIAEDDEAAEYLLDEEPSEIGS